MNTLKILLKSKNLGCIKSSYKNKNTFIQFSQDYCRNLTRYNYHIKNVNVYEDSENCNFISEINLEIYGNDILTKLKEDDLFYLFRRKYYKENLYLKINYLHPQIISVFDMNQDIFLL